MPHDWTHTGGGGLRSWPSPVDRGGHDPVYGLRPRSTKRAFCWRPLGPWIALNLRISIDLLKLYPVYRRLGLRIAAA